MAQLVVQGATLQCSMGIPPLGPAPFSPTVNAGTISGCGMTVATVNDFMPENISPFAMCNAPANPTVIAATAAALGVHTPAACIPVPSPWTPGSPTVKCGPFLALNSTSTSTCAYGGTIQIVMPGQMTINVA